MIYQIFLKCFVVFVKIVCNNCAYFLNKTKFDESIDVS